MQVLATKPSIATAGQDTRAFQHSLENLRGLAIVFVLFSHISSMRDVGPVGEYLSFLFRDATAWFVFISGYLFHHIEQSRFSYGSYLEKKAKFVILPYLVLSVPAIVVGIVFDRHAVMGLTAENYVLWSLLVGGSVIGPMWFIPMIVLFFLASPLFHRLRDLRLQLAFVVVALAIAMVTARPVDNVNPFLAFVHFVGFYVLGILFSARAQGLRQGSQRACLIAFALLLFALASTIFLIAPTEPPLGFVDGLGQFNVSIFGKLALLVAVFFLFDRFMNVPNRFLGWMAEISFGLFFVHGFFMALFTKLVQRLAPGSPSMALAIECLMVLGGSALGVLAVKRVMGKRSRYVIGC